MQSAALVLMLADPSLAQYQPVVRHVAGNPGGPGIADGFGTAARFNSPSGLWSDGRTLYTADSGNNTIRKMDSTTGLVTTIAGIAGVAGDADGPIESAQFRFPTSIWGSGGNLYVISGAKIRLIDLSAGVVTTVAGSATPASSGTPADGIGTQAQFRGPLGLAGLGQYLYVLDAGYQSALRRVQWQPGLIRRVDLRTTAVETLPITLPAEYAATYNAPTAIWAEGERLYVGYSGYSGSVVGELDLESNTLRPIAPVAATGLWGDGQGHLYASDRSGHVVVQITIATGEWKLVLGAWNTNGYAEGAGPAARLRAPTAVAVANGRLYIADTPSHVIAVADPQTFTMTTAAGFAPANSPDEWISADSMQFGRGLWSDGAFVYFVTRDSVQKVSVATGEVSSTPLQSAGLPVALQTPMGVWGTGVDLYVVDNAEQTLRRVTITTGETSVAASNFTAPTDLWVDERNAYVSDGTLIYKVELATGTRTVFAGSGTMLGADGIGASASFRRVEGLWGDGTYLYAADSIGRTIRRISLESAAVTTLAGTDFVEGFADGMGPAAEFYRPQDLWSDGTYLYVTDTNRIRRVSLETGEVLTIAGRRGSSFQDDGAGTEASFSSTVSTAGFGRKLFINDSVRRLRQMDLDTLAVSTLAGRQLPPSDGVGTSARIYGPTAIWGDAKNLYVTDRYSVRRVDRATRAVSTIAGFPGEYGVVDGVGLQARFQRPNGIWGDRTYVYVADSWNKVIRRITLSTGLVTRIAGTPDPLPARDGIGAAAVFANPSGLWGDGTYLYIADSADHTIRRLTLATNEVVTIAGLSRNSGFQDGTGSEARFFGPTQLSGDGRFLYVTDSFNKAIRRILLSNYEVTTLKTFGAPGCNFALNSDDLCLPSIGNTFADGPFLYLPRGGAVLKVNTQTGVSDVLAGSVRIAGSEDGPASTAHFNGPSGIWGDAFTLYVADYANDAIRAIDLIPPPTAMVSYSIGPSAAFSKTTLGGASDVVTGYGRIQPDAASAGGINGFAIFGFRQNGVLVTEASVPASPLIRNGRILAEVQGAVNTGIAIANPNEQPASISFYFTDSAGNNFGSGSFTLGAKNQLSGFLNEEPFYRPALTTSPIASARTFTFSSSVPVGVIALRGFTNERSEFLITTMPVVDLAQTTTATLYVAHLANGGGWSTSINLINPSDAPISGTIVFGESGAAPIPYSIAARSSFPVFPASRPGLEVRLSSLRISPTSGQIAPAANVVFSFQRNGITVAISSVTAQPAALAVRTYVEGSGSIQTGIAITNPSSETATINLDLSTDAGGSRSASLQLGGNGRITFFLKEIAGFADLPDSFRGVLRMSTSSPGGLVAVALRGRYNERGDFLISSTPPSPQSAQVGERIFPHLVNGGGYSTQIVLFNSSDAASTGLLMFYSQSGQPLQLDLF